MSLLRQQLEEQAKLRTPTESTRLDATQERLSDLTLESSERAVFINDNDDPSNYDTESAIKDDLVSSVDERDAGGKIGNR